MTRPERKQLREFGLGLGAILIALSLLAARKHSPSGPYLFGWGTLSLVVAWLAPRAFEAVYGPWMKFAKVLAAINTFIVLTVIYYLVITPYGLVNRLFGKDPLDERIGTGDSYWAPRGETPEASTYERQF